MASLVVLGFIAVMLLFTTGVARGDGPGGNDRKIMVDGVKVNGEELVLYEQMLAMTAQLDLLETQLNARIDARIEDLETDLLADAQTKHEQLFDQLHETHLEDPYDVGITACTEIVSDAGYGGEIGLGTTLSGTSKLGSVVFGNGVEIDLEADANYVASAQVGAATGITLEACLNGVDVRQDDSGGVPTTDETAFEKSLQDHAEQIRSNLITALNALDMDGASLNNSLNLLRDANLVPDPVDVVVSGLPNPALLSSLPLNSDMDNLLTHATEVVPTRQDELVVDCSVSQPGFIADACDVVTDVEAVLDPVLDPVLDAIGVLKTSIDAVQSAVDPIVGKLDVLRANIIQVSGRAQIIIDKVEAVGVVVEGIRGVVDDILGGGDIF